MTDRHRQPSILIRCDPDLRDRFTAAAKTKGIDRVALIRQLMRWYVGDGPLPERPKDAAPRDRRAGSSTHPGAPAADTAPREP